MELFRRSDELVYRQQGLERFIEAQKKDYKTALEEVRSGQKQTHWIWYIFPQPDILKAPLPFRRRFPQRNSSPCRHRRRVIARSRRTSAATGDRKSVV